MAGDRDNELLPNVCLAHLTHNMAQRKLSRVTRRPNARQRAKCMPVTLTPSPPLVQCLSATRVCTSQSHTRHQHVPHFLPP